MAGNNTIPVSLKTEIQEFADTRGFTGIAAEARRYSRHSLNQFLLLCSTLSMDCGLAICGA